MFSPQEVRDHLPLTAYAKDFIAHSRHIAKEIVTKKEKRTALIVGPCSIHDTDSALDYAVKLKALADSVQENFYLIMRVFVEKPRTKVGWKGLIHDPHLDGTHDIEKGILLSRKLFLRLTHLGIPCATEFVDPLFTPYLEDLVTWGFIGARTSASQPHRQLASGLTFPVGFKNQVDGNTDIAIDGALSAMSRHNHLHSDLQGHIAKVTTHGNPLAHPVLRGSDQAPNFDPHSVSTFLMKMFKQNLHTRILIDCSHGNSQRNAEAQKTSFTSIIDQIREGNSNIMGLMLESFLEGGKQSLKETPEELYYGVSVTDPCLGWEETEELISTSISSVQN